MFVDKGPCDLGRWRLGENGALFAPQGGLRISMNDLARVGRMLLNGGTLDGIRILSPKSVETMLAPEWRFDGRNGETDKGFYCTYGLAVQLIPTGMQGCKDDPAGDRIFRMGHAGDAYGLRSGLWIDRLHGVGVAYFVTGLSDDPPRGKSAYRAAEESALRRSLQLFANSLPAAPGASAPRSSTRCTVATPAETRRAAALRSRTFANSDEGDHCGHSRLLASRAPMAWKSCAS